MQCTHENGKKQVAKLSSDNKFPFHFLQFDLENYTKFTFYFNWRIWRANCRSHFADRFRWNYLIVWVKMKPIRYMLLQTPFRYSNLNTFNVFSSFAIWRFRIWTIICRTNTKNRPQNMWNASIKDFRIKFLDEFKLLLWHGVFKKN